MSWQISIVSGAVFIFGISGIFLMSGFLSTSNAFKKMKSVNSLPNVEQNTIDMAGRELAVRALKLGSIYSSICCGVLFYGIWKLTGATSVKDSKNEANKTVSTFSGN